MGTVNYMAHMKQRLCQFLVPVVRAAQGSAVGRLLGQVLGSEGE